MADNDWIELNSLVKFRKINAEIQIAVVWLPSLIRLITAKLRKIDN